MNIALHFVDTARAPLILALRALNAVTVRVSGADLLTMYVQLTTARPRFSFRLPHDEWQLGLISEDSGSPGTLRCT
jgi:hypothetical protein